MALICVASAVSGAPRGERSPLGPHPRPQHFQTVTPASVARTWMDAPVGAPPPFFVWEVFGNRIDKTRTRTKTRRENEILFPPPAIAGRMKQEGAALTCLRHQFRRELVGRVVAWRVGAGRAFESPSCDAAEDHDEGSFDTAEPQRGPNADEDGSGRAHSGEGE